MFAKVAKSEGESMVFLHETSRSQLRDFVGDFLDAGFNRE